MEHRAEPGAQLGLPGHPQMALGPAAPAGEEQSKQRNCLMAGSKEIALCFLWLSPNYFWIFQRSFWPKGCFVSLHPVWLQDAAGRRLLALAEGPWAVTVTPQQSSAQGQW